MKTEPSSSSAKRKTNRILILLLVAVVVMSLIVAAKYFNVQGILIDALAWIKGLGWWGAVAFITVYVLATVLFLPGSVLTLGAGVIFDVVFGSIYVFIAATLGATGAFLVGRYLARDRIARQIAGNTKFEAIDNAVAKEGFKIVLLTRLSPIFPFNLLNYAFGVTQVSLKDYFLGSIGMIPGTIMYVYLGSLAGSLATIGAANQPVNPQAESIKWAIRIVGFMATVAVTVYVTRVARKALQESVNS
jgi:uncharacterized membrane protein YdjX (TVP38/TMEM64 family)